MFTSRHVKHSKLLLRHAQKYLRYKSDVLDPTDREEIESGMRRLQAAIRQRDRKQIEGRAEELDQKLHKLAPINWEAHWRENVEVILVAIVVAVGIRSYFLQPFKIPTGSMQPTLNGIIGYPLDKPTPNMLQRVGEFVALGRNYIDVVSQEDDQVLQVQPVKRLFFFTLSRVICQHQTFMVYAPPDTLRDYFGVSPGKLCRKGEVIARGAIDTGDQVFVDKCSYNFVKPHHGDVFVFRTNGISLIREDPVTGAPFYIKRLVGLPSDYLRVEPPKLFINEREAEGYGFQRVMSAKFPYRGYSEGPANLSEMQRQAAQITAAKDAALKAGQVERIAQLNAQENEATERLRDVREKLHVPEHAYFAMGDNSYNSYDSRYWGPVPDENLVGRGLLVYWPFSRHWGLIR
ncbi:MAG: signal peptidase I [Spartobacteria bacterium]